MFIDSGFYRRLKFYLFGFLIGGVAVNFIFKGKACQMPATIKFEELTKQYRRLTPTAICNLQCLNIDSIAFNAILKNGNINYDLSNVHAKPFPTYVVSGKLNGEIAINATIEDCDTISKVLSIITVKSESDFCNCD